MIKVNQVVSPAEAEKLVDADLVGICLGDPGTPDRRMVDAGAFAALQEAIGPRTSLYVDASAGYTQEDVVAAVDSLRPAYFEFTSADPAKVSQADEQLDLLRRLTVPKIANGFFVLKDDVSLLDSLEHLDRLVDAGVAYFQVEFDSLIDPGFRISAANRKRIAAMFAGYPCIVSDTCTSDPVPPEFGHAGVYFNLGNRRTRNYDFSDGTTPLSGIVRALRARSSD
ncbi:hypothetical protein EGT67_12300 [Prescottella agglutinans]|uniref:Uncharacterized protein n=1 Tax=Prescottella agglutinans TaxID=1644129 RepID=A0A438BFA4_9NOCA|nr:hypothetical protein [Prescottella agglutinans]RVW09542.1 hypothetical protein EGT67_12300 [Prescottella agglutinans]